MYAYLTKHDFAWAGIHHQLQGGCVHIQYHLTVGDAGDGQPKPQRPICYLPKSLHVKKFQPFLGVRQLHCIAVSTLLESLARCAVRCCAVLCCAVLGCAVLCCAVLCCAVLCCAVLCWPALLRSIMCCLLGLVCVLVFVEFAIRLHLGTHTRT